MEANKTKVQEQTAAMLVICTDAGAAMQHKISGNLTIGNSRWANTLDIAVDSDALEDLHGRIEYTEKGYVFRDVSKGGHTFYNGVLMGSSDMDGKDSVLLKEGDVIRAEKGDALDSQRNVTVMIFHRHFSQQVEWKSVELANTGEKLYISRHEEMKSGLEVQPELAELPRHYAVLTAAEGEWFVEDHNTRLGVYLNGVRITEKKMLSFMDVIRIGNTMFLYGGDKLMFDHRDSIENSLVIHIEERSVWNLFRKQVLLEDIDLSIIPGELVLILGGSGAGKTTFMNAVMGYEKAKGKIMEGDIDIYKNYNQMKYEIGFVPQQDLLRLEDNVYNTLENAAEMKMPRSATEEERKGRIRQVLELFGLEREEESLVAKLSGGQRKRLSIAVEYIADPSLFFLDEPDSGLDGVMARSLMENLRVIADQKKIVLVITHSPDRVADLFDKVIVLAKSSEDNVGHMAFYGGVDEACQFFDVDSLENVVRRINREDEGGEGMADIFIKKYEEIEGK